MFAVIYEKQTGKVISLIDAPPFVIAEQETDVTDFAVGIPRTCVAIDLNSYMPITEIASIILPLSQQLAYIRDCIHRLLTASDWTQMPDVPLSEGQKQQWVVYRQALRDFPEVCDPDNPVWPIPPR
jgi:hypothetical protein